MGRNSWPPLDRSLTTPYTYLLKRTVDDWELVEQVWAHANRTQLSVDLSQTPLLLVERAYNTPKCVPYELGACLCEFGTDRMSLRRVEFIYPSTKPTNPIHSQNKTLEKTGSGRSTRSWPSRSSRAPRSSWPRTRCWPRSPAGRRRRWWRTWARGARRSRRWWRGGSRRRVRAHVCSIHTVCRVVYV